MVEGAAGQAEGRGGAAHVRVSPWRLQGSRRLHASKGYYNSNYILHTDSLLSVTIL